MQSNIEQRVMASVGVIYTTRLFISRTALEVYVLLASAVAIWQLTWVHKVFANFWAVEHAGLSATLGYLVYAVEHTHFSVQVALLIAAAAFILLVADAVRSIATPRLKLRRQAF